MDGASVCVSLITSAGESHSLPLGNNTRYVCSCFIGKKKKNHTVTPNFHVPGRRAKIFVNSLIALQLHRTHLHMVPYLWVPSSFSLNFLFHVGVESRRFQVHSRATQSSAHLYPFSHPGCHVKAEQSYTFGANCHPLAFRRYVCFQAMIRRPLGSECQAWEVCGGTVWCDG